MATPLRLALIAASLLAGLLGLPAAAWSKPTPTSPAPVVLYLLIEDGQAFTREGRQIMLDFLKEALPQHRIALVNARDRRVFSNEDRVRSTLRAQLETALRPGEQISHLILATHGSTLKNQEGGVSTLKSLGQFDARGFDQRLAEILAPLRDRVSPSAQVVLDACSTMCGREPEAKARAQGFMRAIGATEGVLYGATTPEVDLNKLGPEARTWEHLKPRWNLVRNLALVSAAVSVPYGLWGVDPSMVESLLLERAKFTAISTGLLTMMFQYLQPLFIWLHEKTKSVNQGHLYFMKDGKVLHREALEKRIETLPKIFSSRSCGKVFQ